MDPRAAPVVGIDDHLPPIAPERLTAAALRVRLALAQGWTPALAGDGRVSAGRGPAAAAVLVPLVLRPSGLQVLLTRRTEHLRDHAGQISFPGGRAEPYDASPADTALREAEEEVGLPRASVELLGQLPIYTTVTGFVVTPVVALVQPPFTLTIDPAEVADAFEVPLAHLMTPANHRRHVVFFDGGERQFLSMPWSGSEPDGTPREVFIWGATAAMLRNLYHFLAG